jgi:TolB-like protein
MKLPRMLAELPQIGSLGMTVIPLNCWSESDQSTIREQLDRVLKSGPFHQSQRRQRFLEYLVNETLAGRGERLKAYNVALAVFDRPETFDPLVNPVVRIEAARLREKLREYYDTDGQNDPVRIELPKGSYMPHFEFRQAAALDASSGTIPREQKIENISKLAGPYRWKQLGMFAAAVLIAVAASVWGMMGRNVALSLPEKPSIAVLPFDNIGDDPKWERLADGITEDVISDLYRSRDFIVIARNSTAVYKGKPVDIRRIGRDLGVKYVVEGTIQSMGERIRVTTQLIETATGSQVWSERYDRPVDDLFAVQNNVTERIAATLGGYEGAVAEAERHLIRRKPPASLTAYDTYLLAMESKHKVTKEGFFEAEGLFHKALELDPQLARAYIGLVDVQCYLIDLGLAPSVDEALSKMAEAAEMAVKLDPNDGKSHLALGFSYSYHGKPEQAASEYSRAETLAPSDADVLVLIAQYIPSLGDSARAVSLAERSLKLNPDYPHWYNQALSLAFFFGEQYDKSVKYRLLVKEPLALDYAFLAMANAYLGRTGAAETAAANVKKLDPTWTAERYLSEAGGYAEKEAELFVSGARKAGLSDCLSADKLKAMPNLIRVRSCDQQRPRVSG